MTFRKLATVAALLTVAGCFKLARVTPPLEQYVLGATPLLVTASSVHDTLVLTIGMRRLDLAPYLSTPAIVVRRGALIETSQFRRWGEDLAAGISRAVALYLSADPRIAAVDVAPWSMRANHDYLVQLHVTRMEGVAPEDTAGSAGAVRVTATWEIMRPEDGALVARGEVDHSENRWRVGDYSALVVLLDNALKDLAVSLAGCLARIGSSPRLLNSPEGGRPLRCGRVLR